MEGDEELLIPVNESPERIEAQKARNHRKYVPFFMCTVIFFVVAVRVNLIIDYGRAKSGNLFILILKAIIYLPVASYTFFYPIWNRARGQQPRFPVLGSFSLRLLCALIVTTTLAYNFAYIFPCFWNKISHLFIFQSFYSKEECNNGTILEHFLEVPWFVGLAVFVFFNDHYPRQTRANLFWLALTASSVIYGYIITVILELSLIYKEIEHRIGNHSLTGDERSFYARLYGDECSDPWDCTVYNYLEFFYVTLSEFQVVAISIAIAILYSVGKQDEVNGHGHGATGPMYYGIQTGAVLIVGTGAMFILFFFQLHKVDPGIWGYRLGFTGADILVVLIGTVLCFIVFWTNTPLTWVDGEGVQHRIRIIRTPSEKLDRYLLFFGVMGTIAYCCVGLVHSIYLRLDPVYSDWFAVGSMIVDFNAWAQVIFQSYVMLHCDVTRNRRWIWVGPLLWTVNFIMFLLDIYDASTLGVFSNHIPKTTNFTWAMFVRSLGPFIVFYRFHSLALISESVEHHWRHLQQAARP